MDVANKLQEIGIFFADDGFVSVLEEVPRAFMSFVEGNGVSGHEAAHEFTKWSGAGSQKEVKMVWDQGPGVTLGLGLFEDICQAIEEGVAVLVISEDLCSIYSAGHNVLEEAGSV